MKCGSLDGASESVVIYRRVNINPVKMSSPVPYLGSKISLISKSEIRYEGILYTIDAQESIIALAKG